MLARINIDNGTLTVRSSNGTSTHYRDVILHREGSVLRVSGRRVRIVENTYLSGLGYYTNAGYEGWETEIDVTVTPRRYVTYRRGWFGLGKLVTTNQLEEGSYQLEPEERTSFTTTNWLVCDGLLVM